MINCALAGAENWMAPVGNPALGIVLLHNAKTAKALHARRAGCAAW